MPDDGKMKAHQRYLKRLEKRLESIAPPPPSNFEYDIWIPTFDLPDLPDTQPVGRQEGSKEKANEGRDEWIFERMQQLIGKGRNRDRASEQVSFALESKRWYPPLKARSVRNLYDAMKKAKKNTGEAANK